MNTLIDIFNNVLEYKHNAIYIIIDDNNIPWFSGSDCAKILKYKDTDKAIRKNVRKHDKTKFRKLKKFMKVQPSYMKSHTIFINESGLYSLVLSSKKKSAIKFKEWIASDVLPSIRKTGSYQIKEKYQEKLDKLNNKLRAANKKIRILKYNQKRKNHKSTGMIYILRPIDTRNKKILKAGKTTDFDKSQNTYNTSLPDDLEILFTLEVKDPDAVENCIKGLMNKYVYRKNKEYYECSIHKLKKAILKCDKLVDKEYHCDHCQSRIKSFDHFYKEYHIKDNDPLYLDIALDQDGGAKDEILMEISVDNPLNNPFIPVDNPFIFEKYCQDHLYPFITHDKTYYECSVDKIKSLLDNCKVCYRDQFDDLRNNHQLNSSDTILIDIPSSAQSGGLYTSAEEFHKQIIVMGGGGFILPNGAVVYPNGKVICPEVKPVFDDL